MSEKIYSLPKSRKLYMAPNKEVVNGNIAPTTLTELESIGYSAISATVPGCFELDLVATIPAQESGMIYIEWEFDNGVRGCNHFSTQTLDIYYEQYMKDIKSVGYDEFEGF